MILTVPIEPKPQSRPRFSGRSKSVYEESAMRAYKKSVAYYVKSYRPIMIDKGPVTITIRFFVYPPGYILKRKNLRESLERETIYVDKKPDLDNYFKATTDAVNGILYKDDGQVAAIACQKLYSLDPRTEIEVSNL